MKMKISEIFQAIQGEGPEMGKPTIFVRFSGCNLNCKFCDTKYHKNGKEMNEEDVINEIKKHSIKNITFTGGEPLLQEYDIDRIINNLGWKYNYSIETNGTLISMLYPGYDVMVISPKKNNINNECINLYKNWKNTYFKFVYENKNDLWWEKLIEKYEIDKKKIYIMPEGATREEQLNKMSEVIEYCIQKGYKFSPRIHVLTYNKKRGV